MTHCSNLFSTCFQSLRKVVQDPTLLLLCMSVFLSYLPEAGQYSCMFLYLRTVSASVIVQYMYTNYMQLHPITQTAKQVEITSSYTVSGFRVIGILKKRPKTLVNDQSGFIFTHVLLRVSSNARANKKQHQKKTKQKHLRRMSSWSSACSIAAISHNLEQLFNTGLEINRLNVENRLQVIEGKIKKYLKGSKNHFELAEFRVIEGLSYRG